MPGDWAPLRYDMSRELTLTDRLMSALSQSPTIPISPSGQERKVTNLNQDLTQFAAYCGQTVQHSRFSLGHLVVVALP